MNGSNGWNFGLAVRQATCRRRPRSAGPSSNPTCLVRLNYYDEHYDERGRIGGVDGGAPTKLLDPTTFIDAELGYNMNENVRLTFGLVNAFDAHIDTIAAPYADRLSVGLPYARRTAANFEGASWYLRSTFAW